MKRISIQLSDGTKIVLNNDVLINAELQLGVKIATLIDSLGQRQDVFAPLPDNVNLSVSGMTTFSSVTALKTATGLLAGDTVMTQGYYVAGDGGAAFYRVRTLTPQWTETTLNYYKWFLIQLLGENLFAELIPINDKVNIMQLGGMPVATIGNLASQTKLWALALGANYWRDTHDNFLAYIYLCRYLNRILELNLPAGHFFTTPCFMVIGADKGIRVKGAAARQYGHDSCSMLHAWENGQDYIWTVSGSSHLLLEGYTYTGAAGVCMENIGFSGIAGGGGRLTDVLDAKVCLVISGLADSMFDNLIFKNTHGLPILLDKTQETHFGKLMFLTCGAFMYGYALGCIYIPNLNNTSNNFAKKIWEIGTLFYGEKDSNGNYTNGYGACHRNCSALYFEYIDAELIAGSIIHSETTEFTHCEIVNIQWEGTFKGSTCRTGDVSNSSAIGVSYFDSDSANGYSKAGTSKALTVDNPNPGVYTKEKTVYCGALTGYCYEVLVNTISLTWGTNSYVAGYEDTFYRIYQAGAIVYDYNIIDNNYSIVHLNNYYNRANYPLPVYVTVPNSSGSSKATQFYLGMPVPYDSELFRPNKAPAPVINIASSRNIDMADRTYPGLYTSGLISFYDKDSVAPAHLAAYGTGMSFFYRSGYHYFARVKLKSINRTDTSNSSTDLVSQYIRCSTSNSSASSSTRVLCGNGKFKPYAYNDWFLADITPDYTLVADRNTLYFYPGVDNGPNMAIDYIQAIPNICYLPSKPATTFTWTGRLWYDTVNNVMKKCTTCHKNAIFSLTATYSNDLQAGSLVLNIEGQEVSLSITEDNLSSVTDNNTFAYCIMQKLRSAGYFAQMAYRPTSYSAALSNVIYFNAKSYSSLEISVVSNNVGGNITVSVSSANVASDTWTEV